MRRANTLPIALIAFAIVGFLFVLTYAVSPELRLPWSTKATKTTNTVAACTREAQRCPDGSYVGRTGANCEFAECPIQNVANENSGVATNQKIIADSDVVDVVELTKNFSWEGYAGIQASVINDHVLVGSHGGKLYEYDGKTVTDVSQHVRSGATITNTTPIEIISLADNEDYWLVLTQESTIRNHVYKLDGKTWTDLTKEFLSVQDESEFPFGQKVVWVHDRWFFLEGTKLVVYKDNVFSDLTPLFATGSPQSFLQVAWDGSKFKTLTSTNNYYSDDNELSLYTFNSVSAELIDQQHISSPQAVASWNGEYWLIANGAAGNYLRYDEKQVTETEVHAEPGFFPLWLGSDWIVGAFYFDGSDLRPTPWSDLRHAYSVDVSKKYGVITSYNDRAILFRLP